jgi:hypothetical protein
LFTNINFFLAKIKNFTQTSINALNAQTWTTWIYKKAVLTQNETLLTTCQIFCLMDNTCNALIFDSPNCYLGNSKMKYNQFTSLPLLPTAVYGSYGKVLIAISQFRI